MILWIVGLVILAIMGVGVFAGGAPFVPTRRKWIDDGLKLANIGKNDVIVDLGSGNGEVLKLAITHGAKRAVGYEINSLLVWWSRFRLRKFGRQIEIKNANLFQIDLPSDTTIIYLFQVDKVLRKIPDFLEHQKPNLKAKKIRVIAFGFEIPDKKPWREKNGMRIYEF